MPRGEQLKVRAPGRNRRINIFITAIWPSMRLKWNAYKRRRSQEFKGHVEAVLKCLKRKGFKRIILIMDNAKAHTSRETRTFLEAHGLDVRPFYLPSYSPQLNEVDGRVNRRLKKDTCSNHTYRDIQELEQAARAYLKKHNSRHKLRGLT